MLTATDKPNLARLRELTEALAKQDEELFTFFDTAPDLLAIINPDGSFHRLNQAWHRTLGWTDESLQERTVASVIHQDDAESYHAALQSLPFGSQRFVCRLLTKDHGPIKAEFVAAQLGDYIGLIGRPVLDTNHSNHLPLL